MEWAFLLSVIAGIWGFMDDADGCEVPFRHRLAMGYLAWSLVFIVLAFLSTL